MVELPLARAFVKRVHICDGLGPCLRAGEGCETYDAIEDEVEAEEYLRRMSNCDEMN